MVTTAAPARAGTVPGQSLPDRQYRVIDLGTLNDTNPLAESRTAAINDHGDVAGSGGTTASLSWHAAFWPHGGQKLDLGVLPGYEDRIDTVDIKGRVDVVGLNSHFDGYGLMPHGFVRTPTEWLTSVPWAVRAAIRESSTTTATS
jgi:hypothetical protein